MNKKHLIILVIVLCVVIVGVVWFSSREPAGPDIPPGMVAGAVTGETMAPPVVAETEYEKMVKSLPEDMSLEQREQMLAMYEEPAKIERDDPKIQMRMMKMENLARASAPFVEEYVEKAVGVVTQSFMNIGIELDEEATDAVTQIFIAESMDQSMRWLPLWEHGLTKGGKARDLIRLQESLDWEYMIFCFMVTLHHNMNDLTGGQDMGPALDKLRAQSGWILDTMDQIDALRLEVEDELMQ